MAGKKTTASKKRALAIGVAAMMTIAASGEPMQEPKPPKVYPGPYIADVIKVTDSDTIKLDVYLWPDQVQRVALRIEGVDTPEKFRPQCDAERMAALDATSYVRSLIPPGSRVIVTDVFNGKYAGRAIGTLTYKTASGSEDSLAKALIRRGHAVAYQGGKKTKDWCDE